MIALAFSITLLLLAAGLSQVTGDEAMADEAFSEPAKVLVESPAVALEDLAAEEESTWTISHAKPACSRFKFLGSV